MNLCYICCWTKYGGFTRKDSMEEFPGGNLPGRNLTELNSPRQGDSQVNEILYMKYVTP